MSVFLSENRLSEHSLDWGFGCGVEMSKLGPLGGPPASAIRGAATPAPRGRPLLWSRTRLELAVPAQNSLVAMVHRQALASNKGGRM